MNYYNEIKERLIENEIYERVKDYSKERNRVITYFEIGKILTEAGKHYGEDIIGEYSKRLVIEVGKKYNSRTLRSMRQLYSTFKDEIWKPVVSKTSWTNLLIIMPLKEENKMCYYLNQCLIYNLSKRQLQQKIRSKEYERLPIKTKEKLVNNEESNIIDFVKNPILIKNKYNYEIISEKILQQLILEDIPSFLEELGDGFTFIKNEYKIKMGDSCNYIDLLLFNIDFNCYTVVELKVTELKKEHIGQIQVYMNYIDTNLRKIKQEKTIGIIICKKENKYIIEYCSDKRILSRTYTLVINK